MSAPHVDARGLLCPWPVLRLARAMRGAAEATIIADDPAAAVEIRALAAIRGWQVTENKDHFRIVSRAGLGEA